MGTHREASPGSDQQAVGEQQGGQTRNRKNCSNVWSQHHCHIHMQFPVAFWEEWSIPSHGLR